jgi:hypothetical protein
MGKIQKFDDKVLWLLQDEEIKAEYLAVADLLRRKCGFGSADALRAVIRFGYEQSEGLLESLKEWQ